MQGKSQFIDIIACFFAYSAISKAEKVIIGLSG